MLQYKYEQSRIIILNNQTNMTNTIKFHGAQPSNFFVPQAITITKDGKSELLTLSPHTMYYDSEDKVYHSYNKWVKVNGRIYS